MLKLLGALDAWFGIQNCPLFFLHQSCVGGSGTKLNTFLSCIIYVISIIILNISLLKKKMTACNSNSCSDAMRLFLDN